MKIKPNFLLRNVAGNHVVIPVKEEVVNFNGMITLNETGAFLWQLLSEEKTSEQLLQELLKTFDVEEATAKKDLEEFLQLLEENHFLVSSDS